MSQVYFPAGYLENAFNIGNFHKFIHILIKYCVFSLQKLSFSFKLIFN